MSIFVKVLTVAAFVVIAFFFGGKAKAEEGFELFIDAAGKGVFEMWRATLDDVETVQEEFYRKGFNIVVDGSYGENTETVIRYFQQIHHQPITGVLTFTQWQLLKDMKTPDTWGALAVSIDGKYGDTHGRLDRALAEQIAMRRCQRYTKHQCVVASAPDYGWIVVYWCRYKNNRTTFFMGWGDYGEAYENAQGAVSKMNAKLRTSGKCFKTLAYNAREGFNDLLEESEGDMLEYQHSLKFQ